MDPSERIESKIQGTLSSESSAKHLNIPDKFKPLINKLLLIHGCGSIHFSQEKCIELRLPDPLLLKEDGPKELISKHLYVNLTKYFEDKHYFAARCVKNGKIWSIIDLQNMEPIPDRKLGWDFHKYQSLLSSKEKLILTSTCSSDSFMTLDENGNEIPEPPGTCIPITELPEDHPAIYYLLSRGFTIKDLPRLQKQFNTSFCTKVNHKFQYFNEYQLLNKGPQGKLVFFIQQFGINKGWQCRFLEMNQNDCKYYYQYDTENKANCIWVPVANKSTVTNKYEPIYGVPNKLLKCKYVIGYGTKSSNCLMGFDAALGTSMDGETNPNNAIGLVEGVLDAGKLGAPFCSVQGNSLSKAQANLIVNNFDKVYYLRDHDEAGDNLAKTIETNLYQLGFTNLEEITYPNKYKDVGEISDPILLQSIREKIKS